MNNISIELTDVKELKNKKECIKTIGRFKTSRLYKYIDDMSYSNNDIKLYKFDIKSYGSLIDKFILLFKNSTRNAEIIFYRNELFFEGVYDVDDYGTLIMKINNYMDYFKWSTIDKFNIKYLNLFKIKDSININNTSKYYTYFKTDLSFYSLLRLSITRVLDEIGIYIILDDKIIGELIIDKKSDKYYITYIDINLIDFGDYKYFMGKLINNYISQNGICKLYIANENLYYDYNFKHHIESLGFNYTKKINNEMGIYRKSENNLIYIKVNENDNINILLSDKIKLYLNYHYINYEILNVIKKKYNNEDDYHFYYKEGEIIFKDKGIQIISSKGISNITRLDNNLVKIDKL